MGTRMFRNFAIFLGANAVLGSAAVYAFNKKYFPPKGNTFKDHIEPHTQLKPISDNLWQVTGTLMNCKDGRNMTVYRVPKTGDLILHSVIALNDEEMKKIEDLGKVKYMIVPNSFHTIDAAVFTEKYPNITVVAPELDVDKINKKLSTHKVDVTSEELFKSGNNFGITLLSSPLHNKNTLSEWVYDVPLDQKDTRRALIVNDTMTNHNETSGDPIVDVFRSFYGLKGDGVYPRVTWMVRYIATYFQPKLVRDSLEHIATVIEKSDKKYEAIVLSHGNPVTKDLPAKLRVAGYAKKVAEITIPQATEKSEK
eukprot:TRINITY_DN2110_c0_g1_i14.p1 TRINITY_DN2110_c0_g1~~TRINITY_DN2110_c0_g1_i14.p1  ORF type:complete len:310 (-),score=65.76 TRINITY_DN2110_c0_g1_i14:115-1044(-)